MHISVNVNDIRNVLIVAQSNLFDGNVCVLTPTRRAFLMVGLIIHVGWILVYHRNLHPIGQRMNTGGDVAFNQISL